MKLLIIPWRTQMNLYQILELSLLGAIFLSSLVNTIHVIMINRKRPTMPRSLGNGTSSILGRLHGGMNVKR